MQNQLIYNVKDRPPLGKTLVFALQQLLSIITATITVPLVVGNGMSTTAALFGAGAGTLIYLLFTKFKSPVFLGSSFAFISAMLSAFAGAVSMQAGYLGLIIGGLLAGLVYVLIGLAVKFLGTAWIDKIMPVTVIGPTVALIGLSLAGSAISNLTTGNVTETFLQWVVDNQGNASQAEASRAVCSPYVAMLCGFVTMFTAIICATKGKGFIRQIPFIIAILAGYAVASIFTVIGALTETPALMVINFSLFKNISWYPDFTFIKAFEGFADFDASYLGTIAVAYVPIAFVVFAEHLADHKNLSSIIGEDLLTDPGLHRTVWGDGVGSIVGCLFGGCPNTTYGESVGCVAITRNASTITILYTAIIAIVVSFIGPFATFLATIPSCVIGGVSILLYGFIASSGIKMMQKINLEDNGKLFTVAVILVCGVGGFVINVGKITISTVACALILGIVTNLICNGKRKEK